MENDIVYLHSTGLTPVHDHFTLRYTLKGEPKLLHEALISVDLFESSGLEFDNVRGLCCCIEWDCFDIICLGGRTQAIQSIVAIHRLIS